MPTELAKLVSSSLRTLLAETMFRADTQACFVLNGGEPGMIETLKSLSAQTVSMPPGPNRKPIVSHANHVLYGWELINRAIHGDEHAFEGTDWNAAWKLVQVNDAEWQALLARMESTGREILELAPQTEHWDEIMLTGMFASAAHTAYHLGAIRQMLHDVRN